MIICWNTDWLFLSLEWSFAEIACAAYDIKIIRLKCRWLMCFSKKTWSNKCVWRPINGLRWRKEMIKWMWCCYQIMRQASCWFDVRNAASDRDTIRCTDGCLDVRLLHSISKRSDERQLMFKLLHSIAMKLNALTNFFWCQNCCIWCWNHQMHWRSCLIARLLHPTVKRPDARWRLSDCQSCIWCRCHQMHADGCLDVRKAAPDSERSDALTKLSVDVRWLHSIPNDQMHWRFCLFCCLLSGYRAGKLLTRSKCRFIAFDQFISLTWLQEIW